MEDSYNNILSEIRAEKDIQKVPSVQEIPPKTEIETDWYNTMVSQSKKAGELVSEPSVPSEEPDTTWKGALEQQLKPPPAAETVAHLGYGLATWIPSKLSGLGQIGFQKLNNAIFGSEAKNIKRTPEEREMFRKGVHSPEKIREMAEQSEALWQILPPPETDEAKFVLEKIGGGLDTVLTPFRVADEYYTKKGFPNLGYALRFAGEILFFKAVHGFGVRSSAKIKKIVKKIHKKAPAVEVEKTLSEVFDEIGVPKKEIIPKGDELKGVTKSQKINAHKIQRREGLTKAEYMEIAERVSGETSIKDMNKASANRFIEELKKGKKALKVEPRAAEPVPPVIEEKIVEPVVEKPPVEVKKPPVDTAESLAEEFDLRYMGEMGDLKLYSMKVPEGETTIATKGISREALIKRMEEVKEQFKVEEVKEVKKVTEPLVEEPVSKPRFIEEQYSKFLDSVGKKYKAEIKGQEILDKLEEGKVTPTEVSKTFWEDTFYKLPAEAQQNIRNYLQSLTGIKPGDPIATLEGKVIKAKDWSEIAKMLGEDFTKIEYLEGPERGYVSLMAYANEATKIKKPQKIEPKLIEERPEPPSEAVKTLISADIRILEDMGLYADVVSMTDKKFPVGKMMKEFKQKAYYAEDKADFQISDADLRGAIRSYKASIGDEKAVKQIRDEIKREEKEVEKITEADEIKPPADIERVDPLTGRPAGVKEDLKPAPKEMDEAMERYLLSQQPIVGETGKILKTRFAAKRRAEDLGRVGDLVKNPKGEGWLIKRTKEQREVEAKEDAKEWEDILREEELKDLGDEGLGERVDLDIDTVFDPLRGERGTITIRDKVDSLIGDTSKILDRNTLDKLKKQGWKFKPAGLYQAPGSSQANLMWRMIEPTKGIKRPIILVPPPKFSLKDERGAITFHSKTVKELKRLIKKGYYTRNRIIRELRKRGASDEDLLKVFPDASVRVLNKGKESKWWKDGQDPLALLPRRTLPNKLKAPAITCGEAHMIATMNDMPARLTAEHLSWENAIRAFEKLPPEAKETFYRTVKEGESLAFDSLQAVLKRSKKIRQSVPFHSHKRIGTHAIAQQPDGVAVLAQQGITKIPKLKKGSKELKAYEDLRAIYEEFFVSVNRARVAAGELPFPPIDNYFTWIQDITYLSKVEGVGLFSNWRTIESKMAEIKKVPSFRFAKFRAGPEKPRKLNLNPFTVIDTYAKTATHYIEMAPRLAKLNELMTEKFGMAQNAPHAYNFIRHWLDFQAGKIPAWDLAHPTTRWAMRTLNSNIVYSLLAFNVRSALIQPAALASSFTMLGLKYTGVGLSHMMSPAKWKMAGKKSNILSTRTPETAIYEAMEASGKFPSMFQKRVAGVGLLPLTVLDSVSARITWLGAYAKELKRSKSESAAINYADDIVTRTQASAAKSDIAPIQRTQLGKTITCLQTFVINHWGFLTKDVLGIKNADIKNPVMVKQVIRFILATTAINALYEDGLGLNSPNPTPIRAYRETFEETADHKKAFVRGVKELSEYVPLFGGRLRFGTELGGPVISEALKLIEKGDVAALTKLMGIPGSNQFFKMVRAHERGGTDIDIALGRYVEPKKKGITSPMNKIKGLTDSIESP